MIQYIKIYLFHLEKYLAIFDAIKEFPMLYDKRHETYKNTSVKSRKWLQICSELNQKHGYNLDPATAQRYLASAISKIKKIKYPSGSGAIPQKNLEVLEELRNAGSFLDDCIEPK